MATNRQMDMLTAIAGGTTTWKELRISYYGEERAKNPSNNAFRTQLNRLLGKGLITKGILGYSLTNDGKRMIGLQVDEACEHKLLNEFGRCINCNKEGGYEKYNF